MATRSVLFTPGNKPSMLRKSLRSTVDVVVMDLEDAVSPAHKEDARRTVRAVLEETETISPEVWLRINPLDLGGDRDVESIQSVSEPDGVVLPMVESGTQVRELETKLDSHGIDSAIIAILETAAGIGAVDEIVHRDRLSAVIFGAEDFTTDMGINHLQNPSPLTYPRSRIAIAAVSAGVDAIDTVYTDIEDVEGLRDDSEVALHLGFDGKAAIHPAQTSIIEDVFTPSDDEVEWAKAILTARNESEDGVFEVNGRMVDAPVISRAEGIVKRADDDIGR